MGDLTESTTSINRRGLTDRVAETQRFGPGETATQLDPGDFILTHRHNAMAGLISFGEKRRFRRADGVYAHWSHCALVVGKDGALVEAESTGVRRSPVSRYKDDEYHLVRLGPAFPLDGRDRAVEYAEAQVGQAFGYLALVGAALFLLFGLPLRLMRGNHQICSGLVVRALQRGGLMPEADPSLMLPADLAKSSRSRASRRARSFPTRRTCVASSTTSEQGNWTK
jgi:uncharacterized protein YycO